MKQLAGSMVAAGLCLGMVQWAHAEEKLNSLSVSGNYTSSDQEGDEGTTTLFLAFERLVDSSLSVGLGLFVMKSGATTASSYNLEGKSYFNAPGKPGGDAFYSKLILGLSSISGEGFSSSGYTYGVYVGLEHAMTESASIFGEVGARKENYSSSDFDASRGLIEFNVGLKVSF
jgi:hypothetical protein